MSETKIRLEDFNDNIDLDNFIIETDSEGYITKMELAKPVNLNG